MTEQRFYYRNRQTGDLGFLVRGVDGKDWIRLDRPNDDPEHSSRPFIPDQWQKESVHRQYTIAQIARIAFEADKAFCFVDGQHDIARKEWLSLTTEERIVWQEQGPPDGVRKDIYQAIMGVLRPRAS